MKVIKPTAFTETMLVSSNAVESSPNYSAGTTYAKDSIVNSGTHLYQSLVNNNLGNTPSTSPLYWLDIGPNNIHAMFDNQISTATISATPLNVVFKPGIFNSLALIGLSGNQVAVTVRDGTGGPIIYSATFALDGTVISDWYQYFFEPFVQKSEVVMTDIPPFSNSEVTISLTGGSTVQIGLCSFGTFYFLGDAEYGANVGITDYSRKDTDDFGVTTFVQRAYSKRMSARLMLDTAQINRIQRILADIRATPSLWIGADGDDYLPTLMYGYYRDFSIDIAYQNKSFCSLEIEGLI
jgi:hypothetical protein